MSETKNVQEIKTERLMLRPFTLSDIHMFHQICSDKDVMKYIGDGRIPSLDDITSSIKRWIAHYEKHGYGLLALMNQQTEELMGFCGLITQVIQDENKIELGYRLGKAYWGKGYATEAALKMKNHAFNELNLKDIISIIQPGNIASRKIATKLGMHVWKECDFHGQSVCIYQTVRPSYIANCLDQ